MPPPRPHRRDIPALCREFADYTAEAEAEAEAP